MSIWNFVKNVFSFIFCKSLCILYTSIYLDSHKQEYLLTAKMRYLVEKLQNILASIEYYELCIICIKIILLEKFVDISIGVFVAGGRLFSIYDGHLSRIY